MAEPIDIIEEYGLVKLKNVEYTGNFTIKYKSREELEILQKFFQVRASRFDMDLLKTRPKTKELLYGEQECTDS